MYTTLIVVSALSHGPLGLYVVRRYDTMLAYARLLRDLINFGRFLDTPLSLERLVGTISTRYDTY